MQLGADTSVTTSDLIGLSRWHTNTDDITFTADEVKGLLNRAQHELQILILDNMDDWDFNGNTATADLLADTREYAWPGNLLKVKRMDLLLDGTNWNRANHFDSATHEHPLASEQDIRNHFRTAGPEYDVFDDHFRILSGDAITAVTDGISIEYVEEIPSLTATTDEPVFTEAAQQWLPLWAAKSFFARYEQPQKAQNIQTEMLALEQKIVEFYSRRNRDSGDRPRMSVRRNSWMYR